MSLSPKPTHEEFRAIGFTELARSYPRDMLALQMFAAWNNVSVDRLPETMQYFPNAATRDAWKRVAQAAEAFFEGIES